MTNRDGCARYTGTPGPSVFEANAADNWRKLFMQFQIYLKLFEGVLVEIIVGDLLVHGKDQREVDEKMRRVLDRSREVGLKFNPKKVKLRVPEVSYVGHLFSAEGLKPDPENIRAINEMPPPVDKEGVLCIQGTVNYLDKFIEHKADIQEPISQLTHKDAAFVWENPNKRFSNI